MDLVTRKPAKQPPQTGSQGACYQSFPGILAYSTKISNIKIPTPTDPPMNTPQVIQNTAKAGAFRGGGGRRLSAQFGVVGSIPTVVSVVGIDEVNAQGPKAPAVSRQTHFSPTTPTTKRTKRWHLFADEIKRLPVRHQVGRALSPEEKLGLQQAAE